MPKDLIINTQSTALVIIDLQKGITRIQTEPYSSGTVIENSVKLLNSFRERKMPVFLVHVVPSSDKKDVLHPVSETSYTMAENDPSWSEFVPELNVQPTDILIIKHQWGAFYGTELDLQLRRRSINTIILCGISTNFGVESTARFAFEYGYNQIFARDAIAARSKEEHEYPFKYIFPRIGLIRNTDEIINALKESEHSL